MNLQVLNNVSYCMAYHPLIFTSGCFLGIKYLDHHFSWNLDLWILFLLALKFTEKFELLCQIVVSLSESFTILYCHFDFLKPCNYLIRACLGRRDSFYYFDWNIRSSVFLYLVLFCYCCFDRMTVVNIYSALICTGHQDKHLTCLIPVKTP